MAGGGLSRLEYGWRCSLLEAIGRLRTSEWIVLPAIGALIGYLTNVIAVRMLFRPRHPMVLPGTGLTFQGLIPRRQADIAQALGDTVERDLLPVDILVNKLDITGYQDEITEIVAEHVDKRVRASIPRFIPAALQDVFAAYIRDIAERETSHLLAEAAVSIRDRIKEDLHLGEVVVDKIMEFDLDELERMVVALSRKELRYIEVFGAVLGFMIGLGQAALVVLLS